MDDQAVPSKRYATSGWVGRAPACRRPRDPRRASRPSGARSSRHRRPAGPEAGLHRFPWRRQRDAHLAASLPRSQTSPSGPTASDSMDAHVVRDRDRGAHPPGPTPREPVERVLREGSPVFGSEPPGASQHAPAASKAIACVALGSSTYHRPSVRTMAPAIVATATEPSADRAMPSMLPNPGGSPGRSTAFQSPPRISQSRSHGGGEQAGPCHPRPSARPTSGRGARSAPDRTGSTPQTPIRRSRIGTMPARWSPPRRRPCTATAPMPMSWFGGAQPVGRGEDPRVGPVEPRDVRAAVAVVASRPPPRPNHRRPPSSSSRRSAGRRRAGHGRPSSVEALHRRRHATQTAPSADTVIASVPYRSTSGIATDPSVAPARVDVDEVGPAHHPDGPVRRERRACSCLHREVAAVAQGGPRDPVPALRGRLVRSSPRRSRPAPRRCRQVPDPSSATGSRRRRSRHRTTGCRSGPHSHTPPPRAGLTRYDPNVGIVEEVPLPGRVGTVASDRVRRPEPIVQNAPPEATTWYGGPPPAAMLTSGGGCSGRGWRGIPPAIGARPVWQLTQAERRGRRRGGRCRRDRRRRRRRSRQAPSGRAGSASATGRRRRSR